MLRLLRAATLAWAALSITGIANAADLGGPPPPPPAIPTYVPFSWTGFYIGGNIGLAWGEGDFTDSLRNIFTGPSQSTIFTGGGQVGANYQINYWLVVGVEATFDWISNNNNQSHAVTIPAVGNLIQVSINDRWITTVAARIGVVAAENALFYAKGGGGWVGDNEFTVTNVTTGASISGSNSSSNVGWLVGAGVEYAFAPNWTAKAEYDFLGLRNTSVTVPTGALGFPNGDVISTNDRDIQMLTVGFNYLFNWH